MEQDKPKSILDGLPVVEDESYTKAFVAHQPPPRSLDIVGNCPKCGSPVYGRRTVPAGEKPTVTHTCLCNCLDPASLMRTKEG